jgi:hypothetical protein
MFKTHRRSNSLHRVQNDECLHYRARSSVLAASALAGASRNVAIVGQGQTQAAAVSSLASASLAGGDDECCICLSSLISDNPVSVIQACNHRFHDTCIRNWLLQQGGTPHCPSCREEVPVQPQPLSPSGAMMIQLSSDFCPGFTSDTTCIEIIYSLPSGLQHSVSTVPRTLTYPFGYDPRI